LLVQLKLSALPLLLTLCAPGMNNISTQHEGHCAYVSTHVMHDVLAQDHAVLCCDVQVIAVAQRVVRTTTRINVCSMYAHYTLSEHI
jgi:hypothetical protein